MKPARSATALRFDPDLHERLRAEAERRGVSLNWLVNRLLKEALEALAPIEQRLTTWPANEEER